MRRDPLHTGFQVMGYGLLCVAAVTAFITVRLMGDAAESLQKAVHAMESGRRSAAATHLEDAAKSYVPGSRLTQAALRDLTIMARAAEMRGDIAAAISLWEAVRRAIIATRHFYQPNADILESTERNIIRLRNDETTLVGDFDLTGRPRDPSPALSLLVFFGLIVWIGGSAGVCLSVGRGEPAPLFRRRTFLAVALLGLGIWIVAVYLL